LQKDLENDEGFFKEVVNIFSAKVSILNEAHRKKKCSSPYQMKQINAYWIRIIKELKEMINKTDVLRNKKSYLFLKLDGFTKEFNCPN
jgi:hypothetical protein